MTCRSADLRRAVLLAFVTALVSPVLCRGATGHGEIGREVMIASMDAYDAISISNALALLRGRGIVGNSLAGGSVASIRVREGDAQLAVTTLFGDKSTHKYI